jgi:hypothetical protein
VIYTHQKLAITGEIKGFFYQILAIKVAAVSKQSQTLIYLSS